MRRLSIKRRISVVVHVTSIFRVPVNWWLGVDLFRLRLRLKLLLLLLKNIILTKIFLKKNEHGIKMSFEVNLSQIEFLSQNFWKSNFGQLEFWGQKEFHGQNEFLGQNTFWGQKVYLGQMSFWVKMSFLVKICFWAEMRFGVKMIIFDCIKIKLSL